GAFVSANHRGHAATGGFTGLLHEKPALGHQAQAGFKIECAGCGMSSEFAEGEPGGDMHGNIAKLSPKRSETGEAMEEERGLAVLCLSEFILRSLVGSQ